MKISLNTLRFINKKYGSAGELAPDGVDTLVDKIGAQLGAVEETVAIGGKYDGAVIVRVVTCDPHPDADRLHVCTIDDGGNTPGANRLDNGYVQVVCGAPNVRAGMNVVWLPPGSTVPSSVDTEPFVLEARELRGIISNGMLASPKELSLGDSHTGLLEIEADVQPGTLFAERYDLAGDVIIDIENKMFTHRPDCFGWLGVAREIAGIQGQEYTSPDWYRSDSVVSSASGTGLNVEVRNEIPELVPRFMVVPMADISVGPSPVWLQARLSRIGMRPINNIVDLTNFYMLKTGQPLHAYDYDKVVAQDPGADHATLVVRHPHPNEKLTLLNGKEVEPRAEAIMIASATKAIGIGGVMGGGDTEVDASTKNIILECASFDMYSIRRTAMTHGIFTDAVTRFNKGQSPLQNAAVLAKIVEEVTQITGGRVAGEVVDNNNLSEDVRARNSLHPDVTVGVDFINQRLGLRLDADTMSRLLTNVEFKVGLASREGSNEDGGGMDLMVRAPFWRTDIEIPEDIVEEVGRLYGYDKLPLELPSRDLTPAAKNPVLETKSAIRGLLSQAGANEVLTYSFAHGNLLTRIGQNPEEAYQLSNALSPDLQYYRVSLTPSLLDKVHQNIKTGYDAFALYEIGKAHIKNALDGDGLPLEFSRASLVFAANDKAAGGYAGAPYYQAKLYLEQLVDGFELPEPGALEYRSLQAYEGVDTVLSQMIAPYEPQRSALVMLGETTIGVIGEYRSAVRRNLKLPVYTAGFELDISILSSIAEVKYTAVPRFPKIEQDICLRVSADKSYGQVYSSLRRQLQASQPPSVSSSLRAVDIYQRDDDPDHKQITLRYTIASYEKTMTDTEVAHLLSEAAQAIHDELGSEVV